MDHLAAQLTLRCQVGSSLQDPQLRPIHAIHAFAPICEPAGNQHVQGSKPGAQAAKQAPAWFNDAAPSWEALAEMVK